MSDDRFVTLAQLQDPVQAELLVDLLEQAGIPVTSSGLNHRALLGMVGSYVDIVLQVPADRLDEARAIVASLEAGEAEDADDDEATEDADDGEAGTDEGEAGTDEDAPPRAPRARAAEPTFVRLKRVAAFAALAIPFGGGHFYARSYRRGLALLLSQILCIMLAAGGLEVHAVYLLALGIVADLLGSFEAVEHVNTGARPTGVSATLGRTLPWVIPFLALAPVALRLGAPALYAGPSGRAICELASGCAGEDEAQCAAALAEHVASGSASWAHLSACASCAEGLSCEALYERHDCDPAQAAEPTFQVGLGIGPFGGSGSEPCQPELLLRDRCYDECVGLLPEERSDRRAWSEMSQRLGL